MTVISFCSGVKYFWKKVWVVKTGLVGGVLHIRVFSFFSSLAVCLTPTSACPCTCLHGSRHVNHKEGLLPVGFQSSCSSQRLSSYYNSVHLSMIQMTSSSVQPTTVTSRPHWLRPVQPTTVAPKPHWPCAGTSRCVPSSTRPEEGTGHAYGQHEHRSI